MTAELQITEQQAFEVWLKESKSCWGDYDYELQDKRLMFEAWNARAALAHIAAQIQLEKEANTMVWRTIESAPTDGSNMLLWWGSTAIEGWCGGVSAEGNWWRSYSLTFKDGKPTHWMPLPAATTYYV